jgi:hypothetical protein
MKEKLTTRFGGISRNHRAQGFVLGSAIGTATTLVLLKHQKQALINQFEMTLNIPDQLVEDILKSGLPALLNRHDGTQLSLGPS